MVGARSKWVRDLVPLLLLSALAKGLCVLGALLPLATTTLVVSMASAALARRSGVDAKLSFEAPLACGMVLLGVQLAPEELVALGWEAPLWLLGFWSFVVGCFAVAVRLQVFEPRVGGLLAVGMAGAGLAAVRAAARADAKVPESAVPLATAGILTAGAIGFVGTAEIGELLALDAGRIARWVGIALPTTAEAVLVGAGHSPQAQRLTAAWRLLINLMQVVPILAYLGVFVPTVDRPGRNRVVSAFLSTIRRVPLFVWGLAVVGAFGWFRAFGPEERAVLRGVTNWVFLMALAGIGFNTRPAELVRFGWRPVVWMLSIWAGAAALLLVLVCN